jgi:hypothetical protein
MVLSIGETIDENDVMLVFLIHEDSLDAISFGYRPT